MRKKKTALFYSVVSLLLCVSMLMGTTFAWFTDSVSSASNRIAAGNLDVELEYYADGRWNPVTETTNVFNKDAHWEPGYTEVVYLRISNAGDLALKYQLGINVAAETMSINTEGDSFALSDHIVYGVVRGVKPSYAGRDDARNAVTAPTALSSGYTQQDSILPGGEPHYVALVVFMPENVSNAANHAAGVEAPRIELGIKLFATQEINESDSFGNGYDATAGYPKKKVNISVAVPVRDNAENGVMVDSMTVGNTASGVSAEIPAGVALADGADALTLSVKTMEQSKANIELQQGEVKTSLDVHMDGVAEDNSVPMLITLENYMPTGLNSTSVELYHVEGGATVTMTQVPDPKNHNEYSYDTNTGTVTVALASFSEIALVADTTNPWDGETATAYIGSGTESDPYQIASAEQLAYFRNQVDGGNTFEGKFVKLTGDINLNGKNFDPIGWGYANAAHNKGGAAGKTFNGIFDGDGKTIYGLYQNGWDLEASTGTIYTYTNCGFGLFAAASNATFRNLTISGADIRVECVEAGILVGLSQNSCTYDNIKIYDSKIANYQRPAGGLIGEVSGEGVTSISNVTIGSNVVVGSLWGDFDTPVGGVIGARWDDASADPKINMKNVNVACRLDVYNDVTSTYQWYAYRRAGMLIGNTDTPPADGKNAKTATADFLECEGVIVRYGSWVDYHYCQFTNENNPGKKYPWVRAEAGENCAAYSNPRYGHPTAPDGTIVNADHTAELHQGAGEHWVSIPFGQLYGGGQGVYGGGQTDEYVSTHEGVTIESYDYSVTYMDRGKVFAVDYVKNDTEYTVKHTEYVPTRTESAFKAWVNAGGTKVDSIKAGNETDYVLYDSWHSVYTARFLDQQGNVIYEEEFNTSQSALKKVPDVPVVEGLEIVGWEDYNLSAATGDIAIRPIYKINAYVQLTPVDTDEDGVTNYYQVTGSTITADNVNVVIPEEVNGIKVTEIVTGAFANGDLRDVFVPNSVNTIGKNAFCENNDGFFGIGGEYPQIQIIYEGTKTSWDNIDKTAGEWDDNIGSNSIVVCRQNGVISGYYQKNSSTSSRWTWHDGAPDGFPRPEWNETGYPEIK